VAASLAALHDERFSPASDSSFRFVQPIDRFDEFFSAGHVNYLRCGFKTALASCAALRG
jgi:hypothetical protein